MDIKDALKYALAKMCCEESLELCLSYCPLNGTNECEKMSFTNKNYDEEAIKAIRRFYDGIK